VIVGALAWFHFRPAKPIAPPPPTAVVQSFPAASTPPPAPLPAAPLTSSAPANLADLTPADYPPSVTLLKQEEIRFKKGAIFTAKSGAPLFFEKEYLRDTKEGEQFQILDYNPAERRVFLRAQDTDGRAVALNTLDLHGTGSETVPVPANTVVAFQGISDGNVVVEYQGDKFVVPVFETDLLDQVAQRRSQTPAGN